jgi:hypothetical protein
MIDTAAATVNAAGQAIIGSVIGQAVIGTPGQFGTIAAGEARKVYQIAFGLGQLAASPQVSIYVRGVPVAASAAMQESAFSALAGAAPYAMMTVWYGPPYLYIDSADQITCGVFGATAGDQFTASMFYDEVDALAPQSMGS